MIESFKDKRTARVFLGEVPKQLSANVARAAYETLLVLDHAKTLRDLKGVSLSLEALKRDRRGQHAIRISQGWRLCFEWRDGHAYEVEISNHYD
jgi:proteic killer suppression protein